MNDDVQVAMLNRGRVVWVAKSEVPDQLLKGWIRIENPKQDYYPQFDAAFNKLQEDPRVGATRVIQADQDYVDRLGLVQV